MVAVVESAIIAMLFICKNRRLLQNQSQDYRLHISR